MAPVSGMRCEESLESHLFLLPVRGTAQAVAVPSPIKTLTPRQTSLFFYTFHSFSSVEQIWPLLISYFIWRLVLWFSSNPSHISNYDLHLRFCFRRGVCTYSKTNTPVAYLMDLDSLNFYVIWLKICPAYYYFSLFLLLLF